MHLNLTSKELVKNIKTMIPLGHSDKISSITFSPSGKYIVSGSHDETAKLWEVNSGREIRTFIGHSHRLTSVSFSPNDKYIITSCYNGIAILWDIETGRQIKSFNSDSRGILSTSFSPDGRYIITGDMSNMANLWEVESGKKIVTYKGHSSYIRDVSFSPNGKYIVTASRDKTAKLWGVNSRKEVRTFKSHSADITSVSFSPNGKYIITASDDETAKLWEVNSGREIRTFIGHSHCLNSVSFSPNGKYIITASVDETAKLWEVNSGKEVRTFEGHSDVITSVSFSPNGKYIITASEDKTAKLWEVNSGREVRTFKSHSADKTSVSFSPDGEYIFTGGGDSLIVLWDLSFGRKIKYFEGHSNIITVAEYSPNGKLIATGSKDNTAKLWSVSSGKEIKTLKGHSNDITSLKFSPNGKYIATSSKDKTAKLWNVTNGKDIITLGGWFKGHSDVVRTIDYSPNGKYIITASDDETAKLWNSVNGKLVKTYSNIPTRYYDINFTPDSKSFISAVFPGIVALTDLNTGRSVKKAVGDEYDKYPVIFSISISQDGKYFTTAGTQNIFLWNMNKGQILKEFKGHIGDVYSVSFSPNGKFLASAGEDNTFRIWNMKNGREIVKLISFGKKDWAVITPSGFFDCSEGAEDYIYFVKGLEIFALDQFFDDFYRPSLLAEVISGEEIEIPNINIADKLKDSPPPTVEIVSPIIDEKFSQQTIEVKIKITDNGGGIDEVKLLHNGKRVANKFRGLKQKTNERTIYKTFKVALVDGINEFIASAFSKERIESKGCRFKVLYEGVTKTANSYILAIGINRYRNKQLNLNYARPDAESFVNVIVNKSKKLFHNVETTTLYDHEASRKNIFQVLENISNKSNPQDVFILYYAGHGSVVDDRYYFVTTDNVKLYDREKLDRNAIYVKDLEEKLSKIKALKQLVVMDACQSGAATEFFAVRGAAEEKALTQLARSAGVHIFASAGSEQYAAEFQELGHGVFTYVLMQALNGKADGAPLDSKITINELKAYIEDQVPEITSKYKGEAQYPTTFSIGQDYPIIILDKN